MLNPGDRFGDYTVVRLLGQGGMGAVYLLQDAAGAQVAAKILDPATGGDHESRKRFLREAELALGVKHPNLVETYDVGEDPDTGLCYILMEYVPGGSLADRLKGGSLPINDAIRIVYQIATVLELARQKGIVHRDIKPANIMFDAEGTPKLADLGIARGGSLGTDTTTVTQTGMMIGTPAYMAPEQMLDAHNVDTRADIYSLGVVFYEMLTGERPNKDDTVVQLMAKAVKGEPLPDVRTLRPEVSASVAELISLMCAMKADERVATPAEVTTAISQIVHGHEVTIRRKRPSAVKGSAPRGDPSRRILAVVFALLAAGGVAAFLWFIPSRRPSAPQSERITVITNVVERAVTPKRDRAPVVRETNVVTNTIERVRVVTNSVMGRVQETARPVARQTPVDMSKRLRTDPVPKGVKVGDFTWYFTVKDGAATLGRSGGKGTDVGLAAVEPDPHGELAVPAELDGCPVLEIGKCAFCRCERLESVSLPPSVKAVDHLAFSRCPRLRFVDLALVETFRGLPFWLCRAMESVAVSPQNASFVAADGVLYSRDMTRLVLYPTARDRLLLPDTVREIGAWACENGSLTEISLPPHVVKIGYGAFGDCSKLTDFRQDTGLEELDANVFMSCGALRTVSFPSSLKRIRGPQFFRCRSLRTVRFAGDAPALEASPSAKGGIFAGSPTTLEVLVGPKSRGWNVPGADSLPDRWPGGDPDEREIRCETAFFDPAKFVDEDSTRRVQKALDAIFPGWKVSGIKSAQPDDAEWQSGFVHEWRGRRNVISTHPPDGEHPAVLSRTLKLDQRHPVLEIEVASQAQGTDFLLSVKVDGRLAFGPRVICTPDGRSYERIVVPLERWRNKCAKIEVEHACNGWFYEHAFWSRLEVADGTGREIAGAVGVVRTEVFPQADPFSSRWKKRGTWAYAEKEPKENWKAIGFDDRRWRHTVKALGCGKDLRLMAVADVWRGERMWIRREFRWNGPTDVYKADFDICYDQDVEIYLNGREVFRRGGWTTDWVLKAGDARAFSSALRVGENVLAITLKGDGASYFDCGLAIETFSDDKKSSGDVRSSLDPVKLYHDDTTKAVQKTLNTLFPGWKTSANRARNKGTSSVVGYVADYRGKRDLVCTLPPSEDEPVSISRRMRLPVGHPALRLSVCKNMTYQADFIIQVLVDGRKVHEERVNDGKWHEPVVNLSEWAGRDVKIEIRQCQLKDNAWGRAYWSKIAVE